jgi:methyl-accepting chemotaxis protein
MFQHWTFGRKVGAGFAVAGLTILLVAGMGYQSTHRLIENDEQVSHTQQVRTETGLLLSLLKDAETGQRGYIITRDDSYLEPFRSALVSIDKAYGNVRSLTSDNATRQRQLDAVKPLIDAKIAELQRTIDLRKAGKADEALKIISGGKGKVLMDQIRGILAEMDQDERSLLDVRREAAESSAQLTKAVILWGSVAGLTFVALIGWFITRSLSQQIGSAVGQIQSSSAELQAAANQQATGAKEQATAMSEIATTISELLATSRQIAESAQRVALIADQTANSAKTGDGTVQRANDSIGSIRRQVDLIVSHMLDLGTKSQQIGAVLDIVSELAEQTNILAINATIEAAGAGDAGKRFAVVADEIRKLSERVTSSTKEIRTLIESVRSAVNTTVMTTETGSKSVDAGSKQFDEVASAFGRIGGLVTTTTDASREIELSTKQQKTAVEQVNVAISNVAQATRETEASSGQMLQTASQLATLSKDLLRIVHPQAGA